MRVVKAARITDEVARLCLKANRVLRPDVLAALRSAYRRETGRAKNVLKAIIDNAVFAAEDKMAICQDTGLACVFVKIGRNVRIDGDVNSAVFKGIAKGYKEGYFRDSVVGDPLLRSGSSAVQGIIHIEIAAGDKINISVLPKGFGCENKSLLNMFNPTASLEEIKAFVVDAVRAAGPDACPPYVVGVGIGGTADHACLLAKKALFIKIPGKPAAFERDILNGINKLSIGPMGMGGKTTALAVNVIKYPTHIAGLPVAVNISCHATRSAEGTI